MLTRVSTPIFSLDSANLSLDFANTIDPRRGPHVVDKLASYADLIAFAHQAGLLDTGAIDQLLRWAEQRPFQAQAIHARAVALREAIFGVASAIATGSDPDQRDLDLLASEQVAALGHARLAVTSNGFTWAWDADAHPERPLWPIALAATDLLTTHDLGRLRICAADDCDWLFYDTRRNQSRKWCDMSTCGNRAKVARYRKAVKGS